MLGRVRFDGLSMPSIVLNGLTVNGSCSCRPMGLYLSPSTAHDGPRVILALLPSCHAKMVVPRVGLYNLAHLVTYGSTSPNKASASSFYSRKQETQVYNCCYTIVVVGGDVFEPCTGMAAEMALILVVVFGHEKGARSL
jgi:hypothetical protein